MADLLKSAGFCDDTSYTSATIPWFRVPVAGVNPCGTGAPVPQANGARHPIRWKGFSAADPRLHDPYFGGETPNAVRMSGQTRAPGLVLTTSTS